MARLPDNQTSKPNQENQEKKAHWSKRAKQGVFKTLGFIKTYTPALISTAVRITALTTIVGTVAAGTGTSFVSPEVAGVVGAFAAQSKRIWELLKDMKEYLGSTEDNLGQDVELSEKDQMIQELSDRIDNLRESQDLLVESVNQLSGSNRHLAKGNKQLKEALGQYYRKEIEDVEVAGLLERHAFNFEKEGTLFGEIEDGVKLPKKPATLARGGEDSDEPGDFILIDESNDFDNDYPS